MRIRSVSRLLSKPHEASCLRYGKGFRTLSPRNKFEERDFLSHLWVVPFKPAFCIVQPIFHSLSPSMPSLHGSAFKGVHDLLTDESQRLHQEDIDDDLEGEKETLAELTNDEMAAERERTKKISSQWRESVNKVSKGVTEKTDAGYQRFFIPAPSTAFRKSNSQIADSGNSVLPFSSRAA